MSLSLFTLSYEVHFIPFLQQSKHTLWRTLYIQALRGKPKLHTRKQHRVDCLKKLSACKYAYNWHVNCMIGWGHDMLQSTIRLWCVLTLSCSKYKVMLMEVRKDFHHLAWVDQSTSHFICCSLLRHLYLRDQKHCIWNTVPPLHLVYFDVRWNDVNFNLQ